MVTQVSNGHALLSTKDDGNVRAVSDSMRDDDSSREILRNIEHSKNLQHTPKQEPGKIDLSEDPLPHAPSAPMGIRSMPDTLQVNPHSMALELVPDRKPETQEDADGPLLLTALLAKQNNNQQAVQGAQNGAQPISDILQINSQSTVPELVSRQESPLKEDANGPLLLTLLMGNNNNNNNANA